MSPRFILLLAATAISAAAQFMVVPQYEEIPERGKVLHYLVRTANSTFRVAPPIGWRVTFDASERALRFQNEQQQACFSLAFKDTAGPDPLKAVQARYGSAQLVERFACATSDAEGECVEVRFTGAAGETFQARMAIFPYGQGHLEVHLLAPEGQFAETHHSWTCVVNSLRRIAHSAGAGSARSAGL